jgi:hypothetical protein
MPPCPCRLLVKGAWGYKITLVDGGGKHSAGTAESPCVELRRRLLPSLNGPYLGCGGLDVLLTFWCAAERTTTADTPCSKW